MDSTRPTDDLAMWRGTSAMRGTTPWALLGAAGLGAGAMYFLDPDRGARRRALVADQLARTRHAAGDALGTTARDLRNRTIGTAAAVRSRLSADDADEVVVQERVRAELGRVVTHPGAILVTAERGHVTLSGDVLASEVERLIDRVRKVRGVQAVDNRLAVHDSAGDVPALQGAGRREEAPTMRLQAWSPTTRLFAAAVVAGVAGLALARRGARRGRGAGGAGETAVGADGEAGATAVVILDGAEVADDVGTLRYEVGLA